MTNTHYLTRYDKFIAFYKETASVGFVERHHITPKCMGGSDDDDNLVILPARAHFICHYLLHKAYPENKKLAHAFAMMNVRNQYREKTTSKLYEKARLARSFALTGVPRPEWVREKLRKPKSRKENYKKPKKDSHKENISKALKGRETPWMHKIVQSEGYIQMQKERKEKKQKIVDFHRENFERLKISRKDYYKLFSEVNPSTLKGCLKGL